LEAIASTPYQGEAFSARPRCLNLTDRVLQIFQAFPQITRGSHETLMLGLVPRCLVSPCFVLADRSVMIPLVGRLLRASLVCWLDCSSLFEQSGITKHENCRFGQQERAVPGHRTRKCVFLPMAEQASTNAPCHASRHCLCSRREVYPLSQWPCVRVHQITQSHAFSS
jgi:hypothetical protein